MRKVAVEAVDSFVSAADVFRPLSAALGTERVAVNYYELAPGDSFGFCYHRHHEQEEVFYVQSGTATFETESGLATVDAGELVRFAPGEFQRGTNRGPERVVALALGAPRVEDERVDLRRDCPECGERTGAKLAREDEVIVAECADCGAETGRFTR
ncbi:cupin domain-containing protein [Haladaptatus salinisoli]|uniref:cupin domain-containing protein n=1 Tax=Haladaptatus salinisoli TaxID=2884876 RepID=UPI001D0B15F5|nr:cupin domain-containing protein [Haladaptatus salinisoli]